VGRTVSPQCSVIIRAFNEERHIGRLLSGILGQSVQPLEVLVVDSGSTDATLAIAAHYPVRILRIEPRRFTFGRSLNLGCRAARGEFLVLASAHVYPVYPDWLERLLAPFQDRTIALSYGKQRGDAGTRFSEQQIFRRWFPDTGSLRQSHPFCNNANAALRRSLWRRRPYDEDLPGLEDLDWASWAVQRGYSLAYVPEAEVVHVHEESYGAVFNRYRREAMALKLIHPQEQFRAVDLGRLYLANAASDLWHAAHERKLGNAWRDILRFRWAQLWGTYRGFAMGGPLTRDLKETFFYPPGFGRKTEAAGRPLAPIDYRAAGADGASASGARPSARPTSGRSRRPGRKTGARR
jgi:glycosyltransferase involved in cell wall biosynthesis